MTDDRVEKIRAQANRMTELTPHAAGLGICFESVEGEKLTMRLPWREDFVGNPATGGIQGGIMTLMLDHVLGLSSMCAKHMGPSITPTLDLRVDHLRVASSRSDIMTTAWVYRSTSKMIFAEGYTWTDSPDKPVAKGTGTFLYIGKFDLEGWKKQWR